MGLANQFGDQGAYKCTNCGHSVALYSPSCPRCLDNTLVRIEKTPEKYRPVTEREVTGEPIKPSGNPIATFAVLAIILALALYISNKFVPQARTDSMTTTEPSSSVVSTTTSKPPVSSSVRVSNNQSAKHSKNPRPVSTINRVSTPGSAPALPTARPARPMKLWEDSSDDAGDK